MPSKRAILLERIPGVRPAVRYALWADVPPARQPFYADPTRHSAYRNASPAELADLRAGRVAERVDLLTVSASTTAAQVKAILQQAWADFQAAVNAEDIAGAYGASWDGSSWTAGG